MEAVGTQLTHLAAALDASTELRDVLGNPAYDRAQRLNVVNALLASAGQTAPALSNTLQLLNDRNKLVVVPELSRAFRDLADERAGRVRGTVTSAVPLSPQMVAQLTQQLAQLTGKQVVVETRVDSALLGGVAAQVGSTLYDGSLRTQLHELQQQLASR